MIELTGSGSPRLAATEDNRSLRSVASQFEAVLLERLVKGLEKAFSSLPGGDALGDGGTYGDLGTQSLASAWAQEGGIGLGRLIAAKFVKAGQ